MRFCPCRRHGAVAGVVGVAPGVGFGGRFAIFRLEQGPALLFDAVGVVVQRLCPLVQGPVCDLLGADDATQGIVFVPVALLLVGGRNFAVIQRSFRQLALAVVEIDLRLCQQIPPVEGLLHQAVEGVVLVI